MATKLLGPFNGDQIAIENVTNLLQAEVKDLSAERLLSVVESLPFSIKVGVLPQIVAKADLEKDGEAFLALVKNILHKKGDEVVVLESLDSEFVELLSGKDQFSDRFDYLQIAVFALPGLFADPKVGQEAKETLLSILKSIDPKLSGLVVKNIVTSKSFSNDQVFQIASESTGNIKKLFVKSLTNAGGNRTPVLDKLHEKLKNSDKDKSTAELFLASCSESYVKNELKSFLEPYFRNPKNPITLGSQRGFSSPANINIEWKRLWRKHSKVILDLIKEDLEFYEAKGSPLLRVSVWCMWNPIIIRANKIKTKAHIFKKLFHLFVQYLPWEISPQVTSGSKRHAFLVKQHMKALEGKGKMVIPEESPSESNFFTSSSSSSDFTISSTPSFFFQAFDAISMEERVNFYLDMHSHSDSETNLKFLKPGYGQLGQKVQEKILSSINTSKKTEPSVASLLNMATETLLTLFRIATDKGGQLNVDLASLTLVKRKEKASLANQQTMNVASKASFERELKAKNVWLKFCKSFLGACCFLQSALVKLTVPIMDSLKKIIQVAETVDADVVDVEKLSSWIKSLVLRVTSAIASNRHLHDEATVQQCVHLVKHCSQWEISRNIREFEVLQIRRDFVPELVSLGEKLDRDLPFWIAQKYLVAFESFAMNSLLEPTNQDQFSAQAAKVFISTFFTKIFSLQQSVRIWMTGLATMGKLWQKIRKNSISFIFDPKQHNPKQDSFQIDENGVVSLSCFAKDWTLKIQGVFISLILDLFSEIKSFDLVLPGALPDLKWYENSREYRRSTPHRTTIFHQSEFLPSKAKHGDETTVLSVDEMQQFEKVAWKHLVQYLFCGSHLFGEQETELPEEKIINSYSELASRTIEVARSKKNSQLTYGITSLCVYLSHLRQHVAFDRASADQGRALETFLVGVLEHKDLLEAFVLDRFSLKSGADLRLPSSWKSSSTPRYFSVFSFDLWDRIHFRLSQSDKLKKAKDSFNRFNEYLSNNGSIAQKSIYNDKVEDCFSQTFSPGRREGIAALFDIALKNGSKGVVTKAMDHLARSIKNEQSQNRLDYLTDLSARWNRIISLFLLPCKSQLGTVPINVSADDEEKIIIRESDDNLDDNFLNLWSTLVISCISSISMSRASYSEMIRLLELQLIVAQYVCFLRPCLKEEEIISFTTRKKWYAASSKIQASLVKLEGAQESSSILLAHPDSCTLGYEFVSLEDFDSFASDTLAEASLDLSIRKQLRKKFAAQCKQSKLTLTRAGFIIDATELIELVHFGYEAIGVSEPFMLSDVPLSRDDTSLKRLHDLVESLNKNALLIPGLQDSLKALARSLRSSDVSLHHWEQAFDFTKHMANCLGPIYRGMESIRDLVQALFQSLEKFVGNQKRCVSTNRKLIKMYYDMLATPDEMKVLGSRFSKARGSERLLLGWLLFHDRNLSFFRLTEKVSLETKMSFVADVLSIPGDKSCIHLSTVNQLLAKRRQDLLSKFISSEDHDELGGLFRELDDETMDSLSLGLTPEEDFEAAELEQLKLSTTGFRAGFVKGVRLEQLPFALTVALGDQLQRDMHNSHSPFQKRRRALCESLRNPALTSSKAIKELETLYAKAAEEQKEESAITPSTRAFVSTYVEGIFRTGQPLMSLAFLLSPEVIAQDIGNATSLAIRVVSHLLGPEKLCETIELTLSEERRQVLRPGLHKAILKILIDLKTPAALALLQSEWEREKVHIDIKLLLLKTALESLSSEIEDSQTREWGMSLVEKLAAEPTTEEIRQLQAFLTKTTPHLVHAPVYAQDESLRFLVHLKNLPSSYSTITSETEGETADALLSSKQEKLLRSTIKELVNNGDFRFVVAGDICKRYFTNVLYPLFSGNDFALHPLAALACSTSFIDFMTPAIRQSIQDALRPSKITTVQGLRQYLREKNATLYMIWESCQNSLTRGSVYSLFNRFIGARKDSTHGEGTPLEVDTFLSDTFTRCSDVIINEPRISQQRYDRAKEELSSLSGAIEKIRVTAKSRKVKHLVEPFLKVSFEPIHSDLCVIRELEEKGHEFHELVKFASKVIFESESESEFETEYVEHKSPYKSDSDSDDTSSDDTSSDDSSSELSNFEWTHDSFPRRTARRF